MKTVSRAYANRLRRLVYSALFLALALLLPFLTGQIPQIGSGPSSPGRSPRSAPP